MRNLLAFLMKPLLTGHTLCHSFFVVWHAAHTKNWKALYAFRFLRGLTWFGRERVECLVLEAAGKVTLHKIQRISSFTGACAIAQCYSKCNGKKSTVTSSQLSLDIHHLYNNLRLLRFYKVANLANCRQ